MLRASTTWHGRRRMIATANRWRSFGARASTRSTSGRRPISDSLVMTRRCVQAFAARQRFLLGDTPPQVTNNRSAAGLLALGSLHRARLPGTGPVAEGHDIRRSQLRGQPQLRSQETLLLFPFHFRPPRKEDGKPRGIWIIGRAQTRRFTSWLASQCASSLRTMAAPALKASSLARASVRDSGAMPQFVHG